MIACRRNKIQVIVQINKQSIPAMEIYGMEIPAKKSDSFDLGVMSTLVHSDTWGCRLHV